MLIRSAFALVNRLFPHEEASAHCDIPCGIYDPHLAQIGALTVIRMNQLIEAMEAPAMEKAARDKYMHNLARYTHIKEEHAELVKHEVRVITGDFFKPENTPDGLFPLVNNIMKTASKARQNIDMEAAQQLLDLVNQFAEAFWKAKDVKTKKSPSNQAVGGEIVVPA
ncbi:MAG TPA: superoxide dismutase, Ni [Dehalococcoidia bacterium]|jgi:nickel superoxide dismutase|nr:superoxide dismutase, Ni [Dehalococcoidia bacterium]